MGYLKITQIKMLKIQDASLRIWWYKYEVCVIIILKINYKHLLLLHHRM